MKKTLITAAAVLTFGVTLAVAGSDHGDHANRGHGKHGGMQQLAQKLDLTDLQKQQIQDIKKASHEQNAAIFDAAHETRKEYRTAKHANDTARLEALKPAMESHRAQIKQIREAESQKIALVLTPEQNAKWEALKAERKDRGHWNKH